LKKDEKMRLFRKRQIKLNLQDVLMQRNCAMLVEKTSLIGKDWQDFLKIKAGLHM
jgi:hypothetical protein